MDLSKFRALALQGPDNKEITLIMSVESYQTFLKIKNKDTVVREVEVTEEMLRNATVITPRPIVKEPKFTVPEIQKLTNKIL